MILERIAEFAKSKKGKIIIQAAVGTAAVGGAVSWAVMDRLTNPRTCEISQGFSGDLKADPDNQGTWHQAVKINVGLPPGSLETVGYTDRGDHWHNKTVTGEPILALRIGHDFVRFRVQTPKSSAVCEDLSHSTFTKEPFGQIIQEGGIDPFKNH